MEAASDGASSRDGVHGDEIDQLNYRAVDSTLENLHEVKVPDQVTATTVRLATLSLAASSFTASKKTWGGVTR